MQPARDQPAEHRIGRRIAMQGKAGDVRLVAGASHRPVHGLDDVAADGRSRSVCSMPGFKVQQAGPTCSASPSRSSLAARPSISRRSSGSSSARRAAGRRSRRRHRRCSRSARSRLVQRSASTSFSRRRSDFLLAARAKFQGDALGGAIAEAPADVVAADDEILAVIGAPADQDMDMRIVGVPVIDRDPVELHSEVALGIRHQLAGEGAQVAISAASSGETINRK